MDDDSHVVDRGWDALPDYTDKSGDADDAVTVSISTTPGEWLVNTVDSVVVPMSMADVVEALRHHKLSLRSLVWRAGMQEWAPIDRVPQLKLAARMAPTAAPSAPPSPASTTPLGPPPPTMTSSAMNGHAAPSLGAKPSKPPVKTTPPPRSSTPAPQVLPSRRATLPFGLPAPNSRPSQPLAARPAIAPAEGDEPEVLAVYDRPAATISFDLAPADPPRSASPYSAPQPQTLAPTTTDSAPRRPSATRVSDLSVVAASDFRQVQRTSKRLIVVSSLASAAAASLLTLWLSQGSPGKPEAAATRGPEAAPVLSAAPRPPEPEAKPAEPAAQVVSESPAAEPSASAPEEPVVAPKPKPKRARVAPAPRPAKAPDAAATAPARQPGSEPNPYDVTLEDEPAPAKPTPSHGSGLEGESSSDATPGTAPGF
jgi:hypothetical protein